MSMLLRIRTIETFAARAIGRKSQTIENASPVNTHVHPARR